VPVYRQASTWRYTLWHALTDINGLSCGGTRMFYYLIHGNLVEAARHPLLALIGLLYGGYVLVGWSGSWLAGCRLSIWRPGHWMVVGYVAAFLLYSSVLRNLPWPPFDWFNIPNLA
jgi:hypothetical protein